MWSEGSVMMKGGRGIKTWGVESPPATDHVSLQGRGAQSVLGCMT